jgi:poly(A) polymerase
VNVQRFHPDSKGFKAAICVVEVLVGHGHIAFLAGGCVRDLLLGQDPKDYDVATDAKPQEIEGYFRKTASVGASFGVMLVRDFGETIEVATFRSDGVYSDTRRPDSIKFSSPKEDAQRRDFTINALFLDPMADDENQIIDFIDGLVDVNARVLRAVGDPEARLKEDHLRALRAVRFAARYDLEIEHGTRNAIKAHAKELSGVSIERIGEEVRKMLLHPSRTRACVLIDELDLDDAIFGDVHPFEPQVMEQLPERVPYPTALVAIAIGRGHTITNNAAPITHQFRKALDLSNDDRDGMRSVLDCIASLAGAWGGLGEAQRKRLASRVWAREALSIYHAIDHDAASKIAGEIEELALRFGGLSPDPMVTGEDLIALGLAPGPAYKAILDAVYDAQLEGRVKAKPDAVELATDIARKQA